MVRVLIVDDEPMIREGLRALIDWASLGCELVMQAENGEAALAYLRAHPVDIAVCDIQMPGMSGLDLGGAIAELGLPVRLIYLTAYPDFSYAQAAVRLRATDYVLKTNYIERMPAAIAKLVSELEAERRREDELLRMRQAIEQKERELRALLSGVRGSAGPPVSANPLVRQALERIEQRYQGDISLNAIARELHVSSRYLGGLYRRELGESIVDTITRLRMERALQLLRDPSMKVFEVAEAVGYPDPAYFSNVFTKHFGTSPRTFRASLPKES